jgi:hypothetical protein
MASIFEKVPLYKVVKAWEDNNPTCLKFTNFRATIRETKVALKFTMIMENTVSNLPSTKRSPSLTWELKNVTLTGQTPFVEFKNVLQGHHKTAWKQVLHEHFPEPVNAMVPVLATQDRSLEENFHQAIQLFIQQTLNKKKSQDRQYFYMQPGGDHVFQKPMMQLPVNHL